MDKPQLMFHPCRTVVPLRIGDASRFLRCPHLLEQRRMVALFDPEDRVTAVVMKGFNGWRIGTEPIFVLRSRRRPLPSASARRKNTSWSKGQVVQRLRS